MVNVTDNGVVRVSTGMIEILEFVEVTNVANPDQARMNEYLFSAFKERKAALLMKTVRVICTGKRPHKTRTSM